MMPYISPRALLLVIVTFLIGNLFCYSPEASAQINSVQDPASWSVAVATQNSLFYEVPGGIPCLDATGSIAPCPSSGASLPVYLETYSNEFHDEFFLYVRYPALGGKVPDGIAFVLPFSPTGSEALFLIDTTTSLEPNRASVAVVPFNGDLTGGLRENGLTSSSSSFPLLSSFTGAIPAQVQGQWNTGYQMARQVYFEDIIEQSTNALLFRDFRININLGDVVGGSQLINFSNTTFSLTLWAFNDLSVVALGDGSLLQWASTTGEISTFFLDAGAVPVSCPIDCTGTIWGTTPSCGQPVVQPTPVPTPAVNPNPVPATPTSDPVTEPLCIVETVSTEYYTLDGYGLPEHRLLRKQIRAELLQKGVHEIGTNLIRQSLKLLSLTTSTLQSMPATTAVYRTECNCSAESAEGYLDELLNCSKKWVGLARRVNRLAIKNTEGGQCHGSVSECRERLRQRMARRRSYIRKMKKLLHDDARAISQVPPEVLSCE